GVQTRPQPTEYKSHRERLGCEGGFCDNQIQAVRNSLILKRRDVRVVEGARLESVCRGNSTEGSNPSLSANICTDLGRRDNPVGTQRLSLRFYGSARGCGLIQNCGPPPSTAPRIMPLRHVAAPMRFGACELALHE